MVLSMSSQLATPSATSVHASRSSTACRRFRMKPSISLFTRTTDWLTASISWCVQSTVAADVCGEPTSSTIGTR